ncbi:MAG: 50S ribosomal protein L11 methyltransferase [Opitutaceae bacterium]
MPLCEIRVAVPVGSVEAIDDLLLERGDARWSVFEDVIARTACVVGIFPAEAEARESWAGLAGSIAHEGEPQMRAMTDADWRESYKLHFKPWQIGRLHLVPVWERETYALPAGDEIVWLDPGMAFGTGNHETTRLCVERMVELASAGRRSRSVIDAGCGSGILTISAVKLGFGPVSGFDNDAEAVRIANENAALNSVGDRVKFHVGDLLTGFGGGRFDLVLANIQADVLARFARELFAAVAPGGVLVLSGILARELEQVRECFATPAGLPAARLESRALGEWADLLVRP